MVTRWFSSAAILLLCACMSPTARTAVLPTDLEPEVGADYQPVGSDEIAIWQSLERLEEVIRNSPQRVISPELDAYIRGVVERLIGRPTPELRVYLMHDSSLNATMLPSGMMIVNTGLLARVRNEAQLAAVLGHEVGHYFRRHALDLHRDTRRKSVMAEAAKSSLHSADESGAWSLISQALVMSSSRFSRDLESEADAYGLMLMARAGYPPSAASAIWRQVIDERQASAAARHKRYRDGTKALLSTHPPTEFRMIDLADTADYLAATRAMPGSEGREEWAEVIRPYQAMLLQEQIYLNDPGASLYLLDHLAKSGWTGLLRFDEGEIYRLRNENGDDLRAAAAYAAATTLADAPPEAWRAHGFALLKTGDRSEANKALNRYMDVKPDAPDVAMILSTLSGNRPTIANEVQAGGVMTVRARAPWKRIPASKNQPRWDEVFTWNGPQSDRITLVGGMLEGKAIIPQTTNADQRVPVFRVDMTTQDLMSMVEVSYRVNGVTVFQFESVEPFDFLGGRGVRLRYHYMSGIAFRKEGSCVMRIVDGKLYAMKLDSLAGRAFEKVAPEFDRLIASAQLGR
jgi:predicted Zn-dependent protease